MFRDNYTNFTFDDLQSENFKVWITNKNDLKRNMSPNFSDKFNTPTYGQIRYHEGTTIDKQDFQLQCVAVDITLTEWRAITEWLSPLKSGKLTFDWNERYYYMVKVSKAISGAMFIKNKVDPMLGELFIVTFNIDFTTVSDWAAIGPYCELNNKEFPNVSIFNNSYCIPQIIIRDKLSTESSMGAQQSIYGCDYVDLSFDINGITPETVEDENYEIYHKFVVRELIDGALVIVAKLQLQKTNDNVERCVYYYWDNNNSTTTWSYSLDKWTEDQVSWYRLFLNNRQVITQETSYSVDYKRCVNDNIMFANPSTYDAFPTFYLSGSNSIYSEGNHYLSYAINSAAYSATTTAVVLDNKNMTLTSGGRSIVDSKDQYGNPIFININHNKQISIPSGRPELMKAVFKSVTETQDNIKTIKFTFIVDDKPIYNRYKPFLMHIFQDDFTNLVNHYNKDAYSSKQYYASLYNIDMTKLNLTERYTYKDKRYLFDSPDIKWSKVNEFWELQVTFFEEAPNDLKLTTDVPDPVTPTETTSHSMQYAKNGTLTSLSSTADFNVGDVVYISFCDYYSYNVTTSDNSEFSIGVYPREVI